ncbi:putative redox protein [Pontibacter aydingkolensis]|uniref:OsmC family protein n=1 Tax=Pontibacter aydingkolensis TaxID=1911536 RepID=A0ABS7CXC7_9BACT|nr:OsmC family protein [Pontibacter aydingkolensis]MBW7468473.1 OsmC family protein [Pontibacter aydingkolensis]
MSVLEEEGFVTVVASNSAPMVARITAGSDRMVIDESGVAMDLKPGADPYDYILSGLGACTVITLHMYAQRKGWPLEKAEVKLRHERIHASDCEQCEDENARLTQVTKHLRLYGDLTEEQRKRLEDISARCPVQKTLVAGMKVKTVLETEV